MAEHFLEAELRVEPARTRTHSRTRLEYRRRHCGFVHVNESCDVNESFCTCEGMSLKHS